MLPLLADSLLWQPGAVRATLEHMNTVEYFENTDKKKKIKMQFNHSAITTITIFFFFKKFTYF